MRWLALISILVAALTFGACSDKKNVGDDTHPGPPHCSHATGFFCVNPNFNYSGTQPIAYGNTLTLRNGNGNNGDARNTFEKLMEDSPDRFCQRDLAFGSYHCKNYSDAGYLVIYIVPNSPSAVTFVFGAGHHEPPGPDFYTWNWGDYFHEFDYPNIQVWLRNNDQGLEFVGNGAPFSGGWNAQNLNNGIHGIVEVGKIGDPTLKIKLRYRGKQFAEAELVAFDPALL